jgi:hypothetical protein
MVRARGLEGLDQGRDGRGSERAPRRMLSMQLVAASSSSRVSSAFWRLAASCNGVRPFLDDAWTSPPAAINAFVTAALELINETD